MRSLLAATLAAAAMSAGAPSMVGLFEDEDERVRRALRKRDEDLERAIERAKQQRLKREAERKAEYERLAPKRAWQATAKAAETVTRQQRRAEDRRIQKAGSRR